nr:neuropeptide receptor 22 [Helicoverpa armigera]
MDDCNFDDVDTKSVSNLTADDVANIDTSQIPFPNTLWHVKPAQEIALKTTAMLVIGVAGIFLNSIILIILIRNKWLWSASNCLIGNLALTDLMTLVICPWFMLVRDFYQNYVLKNFGCRFEGFLQASFLLSSVCAILLVSYDRMAAAALTAEARITIKAAPRLIIASWFCSCALSLPWTIKRYYMERQWLDYLESFCVEDVAVLGIYWHFILMLLVWVPLGLMLITYGTIMWRLESSVRELSARGGGRSIARARSRALRITACVLLAGVACRVPYTALIYWRNNLEPLINAVEGSYEIMWFSANFLMYMNCAVNPLIYGFTNARFRKAMDRTPGIACFKFGMWCCICTMLNKKRVQIEDKNTEKVFVIGNSPKPDKKLSRAIKNILHIKKDCLDFSIKADEVTTKPTKVTPVKTEPV